MIGEIGKNFSEGGKILEQNIFNKQLEFLKTKNDWVSERGYQVVKNGSKITWGTHIVYTVPKGRVFFLTSATYSLWVRGTGVGTQCVSGFWIRTPNYYVLSTYYYDDVISHQIINKELTMPLKLEENEEIGLYVEDNAETTLDIIGFEEDKAIFT